MAPANDDNRLLEEAPRPTAEQLDEIVQTLRDTEESFEFLQDALRRMRHSLD